MFSDIYGSLEGSIVSTVISGYGGIAALAASGLRAAIGVYMVVACYAVLRGIAGEGFGHVLTQGVKASLVLLAVTSGIGGVTAQSVMEWPDELAVGSASNSNVGEAADNFMDKVRTNNAAMMKKAMPPPPTKWGPGDDFKYWLIWAVLWFAALVPLILGYLLASVMVMMVLFLKFALACAALFGPIFVACLLFDSTRGMFFTWLGSALSYALATVIIGITVNVIITLMLPTGQAIFQQVLEKGAQASAATGGALPPTSAVDGAVAALLAMAGVIVMGIVLLMQAQGIAQGLAGGSGGSAGGVAGALIPSSFTVRAATSKLSGWAKSGTKSGGSFARDVSSNTAGRAVRATKSRISTMRAQRAAT